MVAATAAEQVLLPWVQVSVRDAHCVGAGAAHVPVPDWVKVLVAELQVNAAEPVFGPELVTLALLPCVVLPVTPEQDRPPTLQLRVWLVHCTGAQVAPPDTVKVLVAALHVTVALPGAALAVLVTD